MPHRQFEVRESEQLETSARGDTDACPEHRNTGTDRVGRTVGNKATGHGEDGRRVARAPGRRLFAFTWRDGGDPDAFCGVSIDV